jgi:hypothetical protein
MCKRGLTRLNTQLGNAQINVRGQKLARQVVAGHAVPAAEKSRVSIPIRLPEVGKGLLSGQWGTFKTFMFIDMSCAIMVGGHWTGEPVYRQGGVLLFAPEGAGGIPLRMRAMVENTLPGVAAPLGSRPCPADRRAPRSDPKSTSGAFCISHLHISSSAMMRMFCSAASASGPTRISVICNASTSACATSFTSAPGCAAGFEQLVA